MLQRTFGNSLKPRSYRCRDLRGSYEDYASVDARHENIAGFSQQKFSKARVMLIGAGGLNSETAEGLARKGIGEIHCFDGDDVEPSNLNRQLFSARNIGKNKAISMAKNISTHGYMGTRVFGYPAYLQQWLATHSFPYSDVIVCGVDNDDTRLTVSRLGIEQCMPVVFSAVSRDGNHGYVFVQEVGGACFACAFPGVLLGTESPCPDTPAIKDILKVVGGLVLYAIDTIICQRRRTWNYRVIHLAGFLQDFSQTVQARHECPVCHQRGV